MSLNFSKLFFIISFSTFLISCKIKNPTTDKKTEDEKKIESNEVTANVIFSFKFIQQPLYDLQMRELLSGFIGRSFVATADSSYLSATQPTIGCTTYSQSFPAITKTRYLNFGNLMLFPFNQNPLSVPYIQTNEGEYVVTDAVYLGPGKHELETLGVNNIFHYRQQFTIPNTGSNLQIESADGLLQALPSPSFDPSAVVTIHKSYGFTLYYTDSQNADFVKITLADYEHDPLVCYGRNTGSLEVPSSALTRLSTTDNAMLYIDFVNSRLTKPQDPLIKQVYIESTMRHMHGLYYSDQNQIPFGVLKLR